jgi:AcrR family transcriptional regulator
MKRQSELEAAIDQCQKRHEPRVGRPTLGQAGAIEEAILAAATKLFLTKGYDGTSMEAVALVAGISKRTLYLRYGSKEALMKGVVEDRVASWAVAASVNNEGLPDDLRTRLTRHAETLAHALGDSEVRDFDRLTRSTASRFPELARAFHDIGYRYELEFLATEIRNGTAGDAVPARNPERTAQQLLSMIIGWRRTEELVREIDRAEAAEFARNAVEMLFSGRECW